MVLCVFESAGALIVDVVQDGGVSVYVDLYRADRARKCSCSFGAGVEVAVEDLEKVASEGGVKSSAVHGLDLLSV